MQYRIKASTLKGSIIIPPSKSHSLRAILFASLADGESKIYNVLNSPDTRAMIHACELLGANININGNDLIIQGMAGKPQKPSNIIDAGNSGQVLRFIASITALSSGYSIITGDHSIRNNRPIRPLLNGLNQLNAFSVSTKEDGYAPIIIKGPLQAGEANIEGEDSQPVSALLIASAFLLGETNIHVTNPGEKPWIDLTLSWFDRLGIRYEKYGYTHYKVMGNSSYPGFEYTVPGDFSSSAFPLAAALITHSEITLNNIDMNDCQGDKLIIPVLEKMGARFLINSEQKTLSIQKSCHLKGISVDINDFIDALPILAVLGCFAEGKTQLRGAAIARKKECDRLSAITQELKKMGAEIFELPDGLIIQTSRLKAAEVDSHCDHRIALSLSVAALTIEKETLINNVQCIFKSYPDFVASFQQLGAFVETMS